MEKIECSSKDGITIGLIDSIITNVRLLRKRINSECSREVFEAVQDLVEMEEVYFLLKANENAWEVKNERVNTLEDIENNNLRKTIISKMI